MRFLSRLVAREFDHRFGRVEEKLESTKQELASSNQKLESTNQKLEWTNQALERINQRLDRLEQGLVELGRTMNMLRDDVLLVVHRPATSEPAKGTASEEASLLREYIAHSRIREIYPTDLFPGLENVSMPIGAVNEESGHVNHVDLLYVAAIAKLRNCQRIFEFGTYQGRTTYHLTFASDAPRVFSLNLPPEKDPSVAPLLGNYFRGTDREKFITQILEDSRAFDPAPYERQMHLVFVDADHSYEGVKNDTEKALRMLAPGGVIVWHDFAAKSPGVVRYISDFSQDRPVFRLKHTCLVVYLDGVDVAAYVPPARRASWLSPGRHN
jgi:predicted O-methyltransferase YrrM